MSMLITFGLLFANPQAVYASVPLVREKHGAGRAGDLNSHRMTVDLRMINSMTEKCPHPMPNLETVLGKVRGFECMGTLDLQSGYFQMPLAEDSMEYYIFITRLGLHTPTRVVQGSLNATAHFQAQVQQVLGDYYRQFCVLWEDDLLL
jgi:hypothetical protein